MSEFEPPSYDFQAEEISKPSDSLTEALSLLNEHGNSQLFWDKLAELKASPIGKTDQFRQGIELIERRSDLGEGITIVPLTMAMARSSVNTLVEAQRLQDWVVNHITSEINSN